MRIDPYARVVTCSFCRLSSFVHVPHRQDPPPPPNAAGYGHIHVQARALKTIGLIIVLTTVLPIVFTVGIVVVVIGAVLFASIGTSRPRPRPTPVAPAPAPVPPAPLEPRSTADGASCDKAVACCRMLLGAASTNEVQLGSCDALRALPPADCAKQLDGFARSAKSMGRRCVQ